MPNYSINHSIKHSLEDKPSEKGKQNFSANNVYSIIFPHCDTWHYITVLLKCQCAYKSTGIFFFNAKSPPHSRHLIVHVLGGAQILHLQQALR